MSATPKDVEAAEVEALIARRPKERHGIAYQTAWINDMIAMLRTLAAVPREPTQAMVDAGRRTAPQGADARIVYRPGRYCKCPTQPCPIEECLFHVGAPSTFVEGAPAPAGDAPRSMDYGNWQGPPSAPAPAGDAGTASAIAAWVHEFAARLGKSPYSSDDPCTYIAARIEALGAQVEELRNNHPAEGTVRCTCDSYPHTPNCGLDERLVLARSALEAAEKIAAERGELLRVLLDIWDDGKLDPNHRSYMDGAFADEMERARAAIAAEERT